jgi:tetratricopeptide (TPR) repeat protein
MRDGIKHTGALAALGTLLLAAPAGAQYREYYVHGRVMDTQKKPIADVEIQIVDAATSRSYRMKTDAKGEFKFAGLPHARYEVTFSREGYASASDEWKFEAPQERMQRVEVPDVVLASEALVRESARVAGARAGVDETAEKIRRGDLDGAIASAREVLASSPEEPSALYYLGLSYERKKMYAEALAPLTRVTQLSPEFPAAWFELGICHGKLGQPEQALAAYERNLRLAPGNADGAYNAGLILFEQNRVGEALVRFEQGLAARPDDADLHEMAGRCDLHEARLEPALAHFEKARAATTDPGRLALLDKLIAQVKALAR